jgi:hypothetical protein
MESIQGTWSVWYEDGSVLTENTHKMKDVDWSQAVTVCFESQWDTCNIDVKELREQHRLSLRRRHVQAVYTDGTQKKVGILMLVMSEPGVDVNKDTTRKVIYWLPTGIKHECAHFRCVEVSECARSLNAGERVGVKIKHAHEKVQGDTMILSEVKHA